MKHYVKKTSMYMWCAYFWTEESENKWGGVCI